MARSPLIPLALLLAGSACAQTAWLAAEPDALLARSGHAVAWDAHRRRLVIHGAPVDPDAQPTTLEWADGAVEPEFPSHLPEPAGTCSGRATLAYFPPRRRALTFAAADSAELWAWDGEEWESVPGSSGPPPWRDAHLVHDPRHEVLLLFGGRLGDQLSNETWTWDGTHWTRRDPPLAPMPRTESALAVDRNRGRIVLFGGAHGEADLGDTWEWDGRRWAKVHAPLAPSPRRGHALAWDPRTRLTFLYGGSTADGRLLDDTWAWNGERWTRLATARTPGARTGHALAHVPANGALLLLGGRDARGSACGDVWTFDGLAWRRGTTERPDVRAGARFAMDPSRGLGVLLGADRQAASSGRTWLWDTGRWRRVDTPSPGQPSGHALAYDGVEREVLFFGTDPDGAPATWSFDGKRWRDRRARRSPPPRTGHAMASEERTGHVILFGGIGPHGERRNDTWEWDGFDWSQRFPSRVPEARSEHAMTWDDALGGVLLTAGDGSSTTYVWNGHDWSARHALPRSLRGAGLAFDAHRRRAVLFGGLTPTGRVSDETWELTAHGWNQQRPRGPGPQARHAHAMSYDARQRRVVVFGGAVDRERRQALDDTWMLRPTRDAKLYPFGDACEGTIGLPILAPVGADAPWVGEPFRVEVSPFVPPAMLILGAHRGRLERETTLPLDLGFLGLTGCSLLVEPLIFVPMTSRIHAFDIPARPTLIGAFFYQQALVSDPSANEVHAVLSQGLVGRVGSR